MKNISSKAAQIAIVTATLLTSFSAYADSVWQLATPERVGWDANKERVRFYIEGSVQRPLATCTADYYEVPGTLNAEPALKVLLAAQLAGRQVYIQISDTICGAYGAPAVILVELR